MIRVRASELDRAVVCPASLYPRPDEILIDQERGDSTGVGSAVHAVLEYIVDERLSSIPDVEPFAIAADVAEHEEEVEILSRIGLKWINEHRWEMSEDPVTEAEIIVELGDAVRISMHPDLYDYTEIDGHKRLLVVDYKTGQMTDDGKVRQQMTAYAYGAMIAAFGEIGNVPVDLEVVVYVLWLREQERNKLIFTPLELAEWATALPHRLQWDGQTYTPGDPCRWCSRIAECGGRTRMLRAGVDALADTSEIVPYDGQLPADPTAWGRAIVQAKLLRSMIDDFLKQSLIAAKSLGGEVALPNGQTIYVKSRAGSSKLDPAGTLAALSEFGELTLEDIAGMVSVTKKGVEKFIAAHAERGEKGKLIEETLARFEEAGILTRGNPAEWVEVRSKEA